MSSAYRAAHDDDASAVHATVVRDRGAAIIHAGLMGPARGASSALCIVADDRPGLLATISAALVLRGIDVLDAEAYTRRTPAGRAEALDLFWVRRADPERRDEPLGADEVGELDRLLADLCEGRVDAATLLALSPAPDKGPVETTVRFHEGADGKLTTLEVETGDRSGLLFALARALHEQGVQIEQSEVKTVGDRVRDRFQLVEVDGSQIAPSRRLAIQVAVLTAVEQAKR